MQQWSAISRCLLCDCKRLTPKQQAAFCLLSQRIDLLNPACPPFIVSLSLRSFLVVSDIILSYYPLISSCEPPGRHVQLPLTPSTLLCPFDLSHCLQIGLRRELGGHIP